MVTHVWMRHTVHGGVARFPAESVPAWEQIGWKRCDPPAELDPREDPQYVDLPAEETKPAPAQPVAKKTATSERPGDAGRLIKEAGSSS